MPHSFVDDVLESMADGVLVVDPSGRVQHTNQAFCDIVGRSADDVEDRPVEDLLAPGDVLRVVGIGPAMGGGVADMTILFAGSEDTVVSTTVSGGTLFPEGGSAPGLVLVVRPVGEAQRALAEASRTLAAQKERADDLAEAADRLATLNDTRKLDDLEQLAAGLARGLEQPIQSVSQSLFFLRDSFDDLTALVGEDLASLDAEIPKAFERTFQGLTRVAMIARAMEELAAGGSAGQ